MPEMFEVDFEMGEMAKFSKTTGYKATFPCWNY
jgi:hypothetical protein